MKRARLLSVLLIAGLAACSRGGGGNETTNAANLTAEEGDLDNAISGDELSISPEAEDDMIANSSSGVGMSGNAAGNAAAPPQR
jgi:hypothetical protein